MAWFRAPIDDGPVPVRFVFALVLGWLLLMTSIVCDGISAHAQEVATADQILEWVDYYAAKYATPGYPYDALVRDSVRIARCESGGFDERVINNTRRGRLGEIGTFQFLPGPRSIFWSTPSAELGFDYWDPEANVAGAVWLLANGYGRHWSCR